MVTKYEILAARVHPAYQVVHIRTLLEKFRHHLQDFYDIATLPGGVPKY